MLDQIDVFAPAPNDESKTKLTYDLIATDSSTKPWRLTPENQLYKLEFLRHVKNVNWFGVSSGSNFISGEKAGTILVGDDILLMNWPKCIRKYF